MYWSTDLKNSKICPKCNSLLENEYQSYLLFVKTKKDVEPFIVGSEGGYFCPNCPIVVLDKDNFGEMASVAQDAQSFKFTVAGIVDFDAIPEDKKSKPLGDDDNPIPLVSFMNYSNRKVHNNFLNDKPTHRSEKNDYPSSKKIGRNQPCPCGSGKKYKKCCGRFKNASSV